MRGMARPFARPGDVARPREPGDDLPGVFPFTRGIQPTMYRGRLWTMRQYAGFGTAAESNARYRYLLAQGVSGLSVAFDLPTQMGYDSDHPMAAGEVGRVGVAIDSIEDMATLFDGIPLDRVSTSMTINATAIILLALYVAVGKRQGVPLAKLVAARSRTTSSRNTSRAAPTSIRRATRCGSSPTSSRGASASCRTGTRFRSAATTSARPARRRCRRSRSRSPTRSPTSRRRAPPGSTSTGSASGCRSSSPRTTTSSRRSRSSAPRAGCGRTSCGTASASTDPRAQQLRFHTQTGGSTLAAQQPDNNIVRVAIQALAAVLGGTQSLHCNGRDEALALPTEDAARIALRTQQIIAAESGVANTVDPLGGSWAIEQKTDRDRGRRARAHRRDRRGGGTLAAIEAGRIQRQIQDAAYRAQQAIDRGEPSIVGVNQFETDEPAAIELLRIDPESETRQVDRVRALRATRDAAAWRPPRSRTSSRRRADGRQPRARGDRRRRGLGHARRDLRRAPARVRRAP